MSRSRNELGLVRLSERAYGYLQKDDGLGWSNAGIITGKDGSLLIDTLFDLRLTQAMLAQVAERIKKPVRRLVNTHHNGDHCWGNQLVKDAEIIAHRGFREEMLKMSPQLTQAMKQMPAANAGMAGLQRALASFDFSDIVPTPPTLLFDDRLTLYIDDSAVDLLYVGPAHTSTDVIVFFPEERILYAGDIIFRMCTPIGWEGTFQKWIEALERIVALAPEKIVPGHGPLCGVEGAAEMKEYLQFVYREAQACFDRGLPEAEAARRIDPGPYAAWTEPERIVFNVSRAYREFRHEPFDAPVDFLAMADSMAALRQGRAK
ncbi:MAG: MBL fold metallo-hydrolase [Candidatus Abyssobacteria bacterium SURF_5]|uniref:MBL fold metallo-hydrolase n=1 Tax=Abyssobacteria bacterium (strain SURF_5) TaxID=2093360 RepID=A0A3A4NCV2_ABYX5|nr:MAG: MBL fold metallo-hydrolase [Candidatus Abyssubacteria bacterium SURF_5]